MDKTDCLTPLAHMQRGVIADVVLPVDGVLMSVLLVPRGDHSSWKTYWSSLRLNSFKCGLQ